VAALAWRKPLPHGARHGQLFGGKDAGSSDSARSSKVNAQTPSSEVATSRVHRDETESPRSMSMRREESFPQPFPSNSRRLMVLNEMAETFVPRLRGDWGSPREREGGNVSARLKSSAVDLRGKG
jgi:hypothetical protein